MSEAALEEEKRKKDADGCAEDGPVDAEVRYQLLIPVSPSTVATDHCKHKRRGLVGAHSVSANEALCEVWSEPGEQNSGMQAAPSHSWRVVVLIAVVWISQAETGPLPVSG